MKKNFLLAATACVAMAMVPMNSWATVTVTEPATDQMDADATVQYYIYNVDADAYLTNGGGWTTHAVVDNLQQTIAFQFTMLGSASIDSTTIHQVSRTAAKNLYS